jgi:Zn-finger nucleic acid-binding protein
MSTLTCPKCTSEMRSYERNRVHVDQCTGCGGLFLDRGELEALVAAENAWHQPTPPPVPQPAPPQGQQYAQQPPQGAPQQGAWQQPPVQSQQAPYRQTSKVPGYGYGGQGYGHGRRKKSFLDDLFG